LDAIADSGCDAINIDWTTDIALAREQVGNRVAIQGNLDPMILLAKPEKIRQAVREILEAYGPSAGHVFNGGHGIHKDTPVEHVAAMIEAVHEFGKQGAYCTEKNESIC